MLGRPARPRPERFVGESLERHIVDDVILFSFLAHTTLEAQVRSPGRRHYGPGSCLLT